VGVALAARPHFVGGAVLVRTQIRSAPHHALGDAALGGVETVGRALGVPGRLRAGRQLLVGVVAIPVGAPLPDVAGHVVQAVAVGRERADRRRPLEAVLLGVVVGEFSLPGVGHVLAAGLELVAPGVGLAFQAAAGGEL